MTCWVNIKRQAENDSINVEEIIDIKTNIIDSTDTTLDMNVLNNYYKSMPKERDCQNFKPYIESLLQENTPDILFIQSPGCNAPKQFCTKQLQNISVQKSFEN